MDAKSPWEFVRSPLSNFRGVGDLQDIIACASHLQLPRFVASFHSRRGTASREEMYFAADGTAPV